MENSRKKVVTITEAAKLRNVTRQAIYIAIKDKKLKAMKDSDKWLVETKDLKSYEKTRYSREKSFYNGELLFDNSNGIYSINQIAQMLKVPPQKIYYAARTGMIKASRRGSAYVIHFDDAKIYSDQYLRKKSRKVG